jgi:hypothetical protein
MNSCFVQAWVRRRLRKSLSFHTFGELRSSRFAKGEDDFFGCDVMSRDSLFRKAIDGIFGN